MMVPKGNERPSPVAKRRGNHTLGSSSRFPLAVSIAQRAPTRYSLLPSLVGIRVPVGAVDDGPGQQLAEPGQTGTQQRLKITSQGGVGVGPFLTIHPTRHTDWILLS